MTREKVNLAYISNDSARRTTFRIRKSGLMKKAQEIMTLCEIEACAIMFSAYDPEPIVWPSELQAQHVISRYMNMSPLEQTKRLVDPKGFTRQMLEKTMKKVTKKRKENNEHNQMTQVMYQCLYGRGFGNLTIGDLNKMSDLISQNLGETERRLEFLQRRHNG
ncbi:hypothetical protein Vadar_014762 [Vaccinium darrowii]|uniref:Uncharacterized protein n=1 Tax=Vaccinium darrowii TaxID=229202 RepID=A0ACB7ZBK8_9ERIC|nr:hypothetical protein Vadar_014762 [Vaccinium darrowii]